MVATISTQILTNFVCHSIQKIVTQTQNSSSNLVVLIRNGYDVVTIVWYGSHEMVRGSLLNLFEKIIKNLNKNGVVWRDSLARIWS